MKASSSVRGRLRRLESRRRRQPGGLARLTDEQIRAFIDTGELPPGVRLADVVGPAWLALKEAQIGYINSHDGAFPPGLNPDFLAADLPARLLRVRDADVPKVRPWGPLLPGGGT